MQTYSCTPKQQNRRATTSLAVLSLLLCVSCAAVVLRLGKVLVSQFLFLAFAAAIVYILSRYFFTNHTYTVTLMNGVPTLIITTRQGRRVSTAFHEELSELTELREHGRGTKHQHPLQVDARYTYFVSMSPDCWQSLYFISKEGKCVSVSLECDEQFLSVLRDALSFMHKRLNGERVDQELAEQVFSQADGEASEEIPLPVPERVS